MDQALRQHVGGAPKLQTRYNVEGDDGITFASRMPAIHGSLTTLQGPPTLSLRRLLRPLPPRREHQRACVRSQVLQPFTHVWPPTDCLASPVPLRPTAWLKSGRPPGGQPTRVPGAEGGALVLGVAYQASRCKGISAHTKGFHETRDPACVSGQRAGKLLIIVAAPLPCGLQCPTVRDHTGLALTARHAKPSTGHGVLHQCTLCQCHRRGLGRWAARKGVAHAGRPGRLRRLW